MSKYEEGKFNETTYKADFAREKYDRIAFTVYKGGKEILQSLAKENHLSVNALITQSIDKNLQNRPIKPKAKIIQKNAVAEQLLRNGIFFFQYFTYII